MALYYFLSWHGDGLYVKQKHPKERRRGYMTFNQLLSENRRKGGEALCSSPSRVTIKGSATAVLNCPSSTEVYDNSKYTPGWLGSIHSTIKLNDDDFLESRLSVTSDSDLVLSKCNSNLVKLPGSLTLNKRSRIAFLLIF